MERPIPINGTGTKASFPALAIKECDNPYIRTSTTVLITSVQTVDYVLMELMVTRATVRRALLDQAVRIVSKGLVFTIVYSFYDLKSKRPFKIMQL